MLYLQASFKPSTMDAASLLLSWEWILSVLNMSVDRTVKGLENYEFSENVLQLYIHGGFISFVMLSLNL
jgi:hypothetical protein